MTSTFFCIDAHTCGNPVRAVARGGPAIFVDERDPHARGFQVV